MYHSCTYYAPTMYLPMYHVNKKKYSNSNCIVYLIKRDCLADSSLRPRVCIKSKHKVILNFSLGVIVVILYRFPKSSDKVTCDSCRPRTIISFTFYYVLLHCYIFFCIHIHIIQHFNFINHIIL